MVDIPRFDFSGATIKTEEELQAAEASSNKGDKYFRPGKYDVEISTVEFKGAAKGDANWGQLEITYKGQGEKTIKDFLNIPFRDVKYGEKGSLYPFKRVKDFCAALGHTLKVETLGETMKTVFGNPAKLAGKALSIDVGYRAGYVKYMGKDDAGTILHIIDKDGNTVVDADKAPLVFRDHASANQYAEDNKVKIDKYVNVLQYAPSAAAPAQAAAKANW